MTAPVVEYIEALTVTRSISGVVLVSQTILVIVVCAVPEPDATIVSLLSISLRTTFCPTTNGQLPTTPPVPC